MACKRKYDDWKAAEGRNRASPMDHADWTSIRDRISFHEVINDQDNQVGHRHQGRNTGVLERV